VKRYRFLPAARLEATAAATWYRERSHDAAVGFVEEVSAALRAIRERPTRGQRGTPPRSAAVFSIDIPTPSTSCSKRMWW